MQRSGPQREPPGNRRRNLILSRVPQGLGSPSPRVPLGLGSTRRVRAPGCRRLLENPREAHLSAAPQEPPQDSRFPRTHEDGKRPSSDQQPSPQGPRAPGRQHLQEVSERGVPSGASSPAGERQSMRLRPSDRLRKRFEYRRLREQARRVHTRSFVLLIARSEHAQARLGITVSRQVGNAVRRNRVKRLLREAFRLQRSLFPAGADVVAIAKSGCLPLSLSDVQSELAQAGSALRAAFHKPARVPGSGRS
ncbi:MAG: Ribonuclease protein component [Myxococcaceae bacterium]|nr:Ribonuclease protein component [Myxococcaceae bacterium]